MIKLFQKKYVAKHERQWGDKNDYPDCTQIVYLKSGIAVVSLFTMSLLKKSLPNHCNGLEMPLPITVLVRFWSDCLKSPTLSLYTSTDLPGDSPGFRHGAYSPNTAALEFILREVCLHILVLEVSDSVDGRLGSNI